ncbi:MAG: hypothetical protein WCK89_22730 [bacterium]
MSRRLRAVLLALVSACGASAQTVYWNFNTETPTSNAVTNVTAGPLSRWDGGDTAMLSGSSVSTTNEYISASGGSNAMAYAAGLALNTNTSAYFQFTLTPAEGYILNLTNVSFGVRSTLTGPQAFSIRNSLDNFVGDLATGSIGNDSTWVLKSVAPLFRSSVAGEPVTFRIYGYNGTSKALNWRIDDLSLEVAAAVPKTPNGFMMLVK